MRLYDCFEFEDSDAASPGKPVRATDLRFDQQILLHRWRPERGELLADQQKAREICEPAGSEFFSDGKSLWLVETTEGSALAVLAKLRIAGLFTAPVPAATPAPTPAPTTRLAPTITPKTKPVSLHCAQCGLPRGKKSLLCPACLRQVELNRRRAMPKRSRTRSILIIATAIVATVLLLIGLGIRAVSRLVLAELPPTATLSADRLLINRGECVRLNWTSANARTASLAPGLGLRPLNGQAKVCPIESTTYSLALIGSGGNAARQLRVIVRRPARAGNSKRSSPYANHARPESGPPSGLPAPQ